MIKRLAFVDCEDIVTGISKMKLSKQNTYNEVFAEVEKLALKLIKSYEGRSFSFK
jgi:hypothetical protein